MVNLTDCLNFSYSINTRVDDVNHRNRMARAAPIWLLGGRTFLKRALRTRFVSPMVHVFARPRRSHFMILSD